MRVWLVIASIFLGCLKLCAQTDAKFEKDVDYVACICINSTLLGREKPKDCNTSTFNKKDLEKKGKTIALFDEFQKLKGEKIKNPKKFLSQDIFSNDKKYNSIFTFAEKRRKDGRFAAIESKIEEYFNPQKPEPKTDSLAQNEAQLPIADSPKKKQTTQNTTIMPENTTLFLTFYDYSLYDLIAAGFIVLLLVLFVLLERKVSSFEHQSKNRSETTKPLSVKTESLDSSKLDRLEHDIRLLRNEIRDLKPTISSTQSDRYEEKPVQVDLPLPPKPAQDVFYMATPSGEKSFDVSAQSSQFRATQSLYKFTPTGYGRADFEFSSDDTGIRDSVNSPHIYIDPVCEPQNALNQNAKRIVNVRPGTAEKRNDKWIVITKAQIKYE